MSPRHSSDDEDVDNDVDESTRPGRNGLKHPEIFKSRIFADDEDKEEGEVCFISRGSRLYIHNTTVFIH